MIPTHEGQTARIEAVERNGAARRLPRGGVMTLAVDRVESI
jgi:hypothetical protein